MNKSAYTEMVESLRKKIARLNKEYIESNIKFPVGTKVKVTNSDGKERIGVVTSHYIDGYDVVPYVMQLTNNGEVSKRRIIVHPWNTVEQI